MPPLVTGRWPLLILLSVVGCASAPNLGDGSDEAPTNGGLQEAAWGMAKSCGVEPGDADKAKELNTQLMAGLKGVMSAERVACARIIVRTTLVRDLGERAAQIAIATSIVETHLDNYTVATDHDSLGLFQQRPSAGWGNKDQLTDPVYATNAFLNAMVKRYGDSWRDRPVGEVAQGVQRSAFPSRYEPQANDGLIIARALGKPTCPNTPGFTGGAIDQKFQALGGCTSFLGGPTTGERQTPNGKGRFNHFEHGSIYWTPDTGAHEVHGVIRDAWEVAGWEAGGLGFPTSDVTATEDKVGSYSNFQKGAVYVSPTTGAHSVYGKILAKWTEMGLERGELGYPISDEYDISGGRQSDFEHGSIKWADNTATVEMR